MSTEFIIGTIIGLIGIIPVIIHVVKWVKKPKLNELMKRLVDNRLSTKAHRKVLMRMNLILLRSGKHISSEYINNFVLEKRGKEKSGCAADINSGPRPHNRCPTLLPEAAEGRQAEGENGHPQAAEI